MEGHQVRSSPRRVGAHVPLLTRGFRAALLGGLFVVLSVMFLIAPQVAEAAGPNAILTPTGYATNPVTRADAPLYLLEGSHVLGGSVFPHNLTRIGDKDWLYCNPPHGEAVARQKILTGGTGFAAMWHACTLHGTQPDAADHERISLRYLIARRHAGHTGIDEVNATLQGPLSLTATRADLAADGSAAIKSNTVLKA